MSTTTTNLALVKPATSDGVSVLRTSIGANADILDPLVDGHLKTYLSLLERGADSPAAQTAGTYALGSSGLVASAAASSTQWGPNPFYLDPADLAVVGRTLKYRLRGIVLCNATAPAINYTLGLYPATFAGGANSFTFTLGTVVSGSTVALATPSASAGAQGNSGDFTAPSAGFFAIGVVLSGTQAASSLAHVRGRLQARFV